MLRMAGLIRRSNRWCIGRQYERRIQTLIAELKRLPRGYLRMNRWADADLPPCQVEAAMENPCGTACCLAGKAGLMPVFQEQGFSWKFDDIAWWNSHPDAVTSADNVFTVSPQRFFGEVVTNAVFTGHWCLGNLHTSRHAILALEDLLKDPLRAGREARGWKPSPDVARRILRSKPKIKGFPVSGKQERRHGECFVVEAIPPR